MMSPLGASHPPGPAPARDHRGNAAEVIGDAEAGDAAVADDTPEGIDAPAREVAVRFAVGMGEEDEAAPAAAPLEAADDSAALARLERLAGGESSLRVTAAGSYSTVSTAQPMAASAAATRACTAASPSRPRRMSSCRKAMGVGLVMRASGQGMAAPGGAGGGEDLAGRDIVLEGAAIGEDDAPAFGRRTGATGGEVVEAHEGPAATACPVHWWRSRSGWSEMTVSAARISAGSSSCAWDRRARRRRGCRHPAAARWGVASRPATA